jgi:hypothetical protein
LKKFLNMLNPGQSNLSNYDLFSQHIGIFFEGHNITERRWKWGPIKDILPQFRIIEVEPGPRSQLWVYISSGAWEAADKNTGYIEFMMIAPEKNVRFAELLAMVTFYHANPQHRLGLGHTVPLGEPWLDDSLCDHLFVSHPYPYGPELEVWKIEKGHGHLFWLLPITKAERDFKVQYGAEELEKRFEDIGVEYWRPDRKSVV